MRTASLKDVRVETPAMRVFRGAPRRREMSGRRLSLQRRRRERR